MTIPPIYIVSNPDAGTFDQSDLPGDFAGVGVAASELAIDDVGQAPAGVRLVAAGGDGTVATCAAHAVEAGCELAVLPFGTGNDFARAMEIPLAGAAALRVAARSRRTRRIDAAYAGERLFLNSVSVGLSVAAAEAADGPAKQALGAPAYALGAALAAIREDPWPMRVEVDGREMWSGDAWQVVCANTGNFGGGAEVEAKPDDGQLDVYIFAPTGRTSLVARAWGMLRGSVRHQRGVVHLQGARVAIDARGQGQVNIDGELVEQAGEVRCSVRAGALEVVVPEPGVDYLVDES